MTIDLKDRNAAAGMAGEDPGTGSKIYLTVRAGSMPAPSSYFITATSQQKGNTCQTMLNIRFRQNLSLSLLSSDAAKAEVFDF
jgi:hypothetical protein